MPKNVKRCYYCGAKVTLTSKYKKGKRTEEKERTIFHFPSCKPAKTGEVKTLYPGIVHGGYICF